VKSCYALHLHAGPEVIPRKYDSFQADEALQQEDMAGAVLKSHHFSTVPFVQMARDRGFGKYGVLSPLIIMSAV